MDPAFEPRFVRRYAELAEVVGEATALYLDDVKAARFPTEANAYSDQASPVRLAASGGEGLATK
jgi:ketopantoate hydroxymethyltransferase